MIDEKLMYIDHVPFPTDDGSYDIAKYATTFYSDNFYGDDSEIGTVIYLESYEKYRIKVHFKDFHYAFNASDESTLQKKYFNLGELADKYKIDLQGDKGIIFEIENSEFVNSIHKGNMDFYKTLEKTLRHFVIFTEENIVELISGTAPSISVHEQKYRTKIV